MTNNEQGKHGGNTEFRFRSTILKVMRNSRVMLLLAAPMFLGACDPCGNDIQGTVNSPDGKLKAVVFTRGCGTASETYTQISVLTKNAELPNDSGNVYSEEGESSIPMRWTGNSMLLVMRQADKYSEKEVSVSTGIFKKRKVQITYEP